MRDRRSSAGLRGSVHFPGSRNVGGGCLSSSPLSFPPSRLCFVAVEAFVAKWHRDALGNALQTDASRGLLPGRWWGLLLIDRCPTSVARCFLPMAMQPRGRFPFEPRRVGPTPMLRERMRMKRARCL